MFKLNDLPDFWWPVVVRRPHADKPGEMVSHALELKFRWLDDDAYVEWLSRVREQALSDRDAIAELVLDFRKVAGPDGQPLPSGADNLARLLAQQGVGTAAAQAYFGARDEAAKKN